MAQGRRAHPAAGRRLRGRVGRRLLRRHLLLRRLLLLLLLLLHLRRRRRGRHHMYVQFVTQRTLCRLTRHHVGRYTPKTPRHRSGTRPPLLVRGKCRRSVRVVTRPLGPLNAQSRAIDAPRPLPALEKCEKPHAIGGGVDRLFRVVSRGARRSGVKTATSRVRVRHAEICGRRE